jgi:Uncharacterised nucleotidyltransferase
LQRAKAAGIEKGENRVSERPSKAGPHPALIDLAAGRGLPIVTDFMPLLRSAYAHGMSGLLLSEVERTDQPWRRLALGVLTARQASVRAWHERLWAGLASVSAVLDDVGVDVAIAKGIAAEARWYARIGERPCNDLDLLLSPAHLGQVDDVIAAIEPSHPLCGKVRRLAERGLLQSVDLMHEGVPIDLHFDILKLGIPSRNRQAIWDRTVPFTLPDGRSLRALDAECSYVHFLMHLNKDRFRRLLGFVDVARVYEREDLDHAVVERLVRADGLEASVSASWDVVLDTLDLHARNEFRVAPVRSLIWHIAWRPSVRLRATESTIRFRHRQWLIAALGRGRTVEAVRCWIRVTLPPADLLAYLHSDYATRWGAEPLSTAPRSRLWSLTIGRVQGSMDRRRRAAKAARLGAGGTGQSRLHLGHRERPEAARRGSGPPPN